MITIVAKMGSKELIYEYLEKKIGPKYIKFYTKLGDLPPPEEFGNKDKQQPLSLTTWSWTNSRKSLNSYAIRCRKHGAGVSLMYLTQSYYKTSRPLRLQMNYIVLFKLSSARSKHDPLRVLRRSGQRRTKAHLQGCHETKVQLPKD